MSLPAPLAKNLYKFPKCHGWLNLKGTSDFAGRYVRMGDYSAINLQNSFETEDVYGNDSPTRSLRDQILVQKSGTLNWGVRNMTPLAHSLIFLSDPDAYHTQSIIAADSEFVTDPLGVTEAVVLPFINGVLALVSDGDAVDPIEYLEGQHYVFDAASGIFEVVAHPAGVTVVDGRAAVTIIHSAPAITPTDKIRRGGVMQLDDGIRASALFLQIGKGPNLRITLHDVKFLNSEEIPIGNDENSPVVVSLTGALSEDPTKPAGFRWGEVLEIKQAA